MASLTVALETGQHRRSGQPSRLIQLLHRSRSGVAATVAMVTAVLLTPNRVALRRLAEMPLTLVAVGFCDTAAWQGPSWLGWLVMGLSLMFVEHLISDPPRPA